MSTLLSRNPDSFSTNPDDEKKEPIALDIDEKNVEQTSNIYDDSLLGKYFVPLESYEGYSRFDPKAVWTIYEEARVVRRVDISIMLWCCVMFFALQIDRTTIGFALTDNFLKELRLNTNDYNNGQLIFYISFIIAELPWQLLSKKLGPQLWLPVQLSLWSIVSLSQSWIRGRASFFATRCLLGIFQGGFIPVTILYLTYFYKSRELPIRLSWFWATSTFTNIVSAFLAYGILHLRGRGGWSGWRWLFLIEGILTFVIGVITYFYLPASPTQTKGKLRGPKGWFNEREETIMVNRILRDDPGKGRMSNSQPLSLRDVWNSLSDYDNWPLYLIGLTAYIPPGPPTTYITLTLQSLGFGTFNSSLLTIPASVIFITNLVLLTLLSKHLKERSLVCLIGNLWSLPFLFALEYLPPHKSSWVRFALETLLISSPYAHAIVVAWNSEISQTVRTRTVSAALYNMFVQAGAIVGTQIYRDKDKPLYHKGNKILIGICFFNIFLFLGTKAYYVARNRWKARVWNGWSPEEKAEYLATTRDKGNKRVDFMFVH